MSLEDDFKDAADRVQNLTARPSNDDLLSLYALFKQGSVGDVAGKRPGMLDVKGRAKYDAWAKVKGKSKDDAMTAYIALVDKLGG
jgi:acyl-CoA-binding protein